MNGISRFCENDYPWRYANNFSLINVTVMILFNSEVMILFNSDIVGCLQEIMGRQAYYVLEKVIMKD